MGQDRGDILTGDIEFQNGAASKFTVEIRAFQRDLNLLSKPRDGRGTGAWARSRVFRKGGQLVLDGRVREDGFYIPDDLTGETCNITLTHHGAGDETPGAEALVVRVDGHQLRLEDKENQTWWRIRIAATIIELPTQAGFGDADQPEAGAQTPSDLELYVGLTKTYDPKGLQTAATCQFEMWPLGDTDADENQAIADLVAGVVARFSGAKVRTAQLLPDRDYDAGIITVTFGLTDTQDDVEMPVTAYTVDAGANVIWGQVDICKVQNTATVSWPATPSEPPNLKHGTVDKLQLNDGRWKLTYHFVRNDSTDAIILPRTKTISDPDDFGESATIGIVTDSETPPDAPDAPLGQLISTATDPVTVVNGGYTGFWAHTFEYGPTTKLQKILFDAADLTVDPSHINDAEIVPVFTSSSTAPATPTPANTDLKFSRRTAKRLQGTPEEWIHLFEFARNTAEDEREHTKRNKDADGIGEEERIPVLHTSATVAPSTPSQAGTASNLTDIDVQRLTVPSGSYTGLWLWTFVYGPNTRKQSIEQDGTDLSIDPAEMDGDDVQTLTNGSATPPATPDPRIDGQVLNRRTSKRKQHTPEKWEHKYYFGYRTSAQKLVADKTHTEIDPSGLQSSATTAELWLVEDGEPDAPTLDGLKLRTFDDINTNNPAKKLRWYKWGLTTPAEDVENANTFEEVDPWGLQSKQQVASFGTPALTGSGLVERSTNTREYNDGKTLTTIEGGKRYTYQDLTFPATYGHVDVDVIDDEVQLSIVSSSATAAFGTVTGYALVYTHSKPETDDGKYHHVARYRRNTGGEQVQFDGSHIITSADSLGDVEYITTIDDATPTVPDAPTYNGVALELSQTRKQQLTKRPVGSEKFKYTFVFARNTPKTEMERGGTATTFDADHVSDRATITEVYDTDDDAPDDPTAPAEAPDLVVFDQTVRAIDNKSSVRKTDMQLYTPKSKFEFDTSIAEYRNLANVGRIVSEIINDDSSDIVDLAIAEAGISNVDATIDTVSFKRQNLKTVEKLARYVQSEMGVSGESRGYITKRDAFLVGGAVFVNVARKVQRGSGLWEVLLTPLTAWGFRVDFGFRRRISDSSITLYLSSLTNHTNDDTFFGFGTTGVTYFGSNFRNSFSIPTTSVTEYDRLCAFDYLGWYDYAGITTGWLTVDFEPALGLNLASAFGWAASAFPTADFDPLLIA